MLSAVLPALREAGLLSEGQAVCGGCVAGDVVGVSVTALQKEGEFVTAEG